jgi:hypothetical protein
MIIDKRKLKSIYTKFDLLKGFVMTAENHAVLC